MYNKICVYAICKNESKFVENWVKSMSEADYVVVLDTGSTDDTYEKLKSFEDEGLITKVVKKEINPWRFDTARNESLKLVPEDANILMCTDLDEFLVPGWAEVLREKWNPDAHVRAYYKYVWSHNENGDPEHIFWYDKIHSRDYLWKFPVHEALYSPKFDEAYEKEHSIFIDSGIVLHHYPDLTKSRKSYLDLLEIRVKENENDFYGKFYLAREYSFYRKYNDAIRVFKEILNSGSENVNDDLVISACYTFIGDCYRQMNIPEKAIMNYMYSIESDRTYREPYLFIAEILNELKLYSVAIDFVNMALNNSIRHYNWLERGNTWREKPFDILGIAYYYLEDMENAKIYMEEALKYNPTDERLLNNLKYIK